MQATAFVGNVVFKGSYARDQQSATESAASVALFNLVSKFGKSREGKKTYR